MTKARADLLWTGGWDSTFRVLQALVLEGRDVQPYYIIDLSRKGFQAEIRSMARIKKLILKQFQSVNAKLLPVEMFLMDDVPDQPHLWQMHQALRTRGWLGEQYVWLAAFAHWRAIPRLELAIHRDDRAHAFVEPFVVPDSDGIYCLGTALPDPSLELFRPFIFPLLKMSKLEMSEVAEEHGFTNILEETWFCHSPDAKGRPCGRCNPCEYTIEEGLGRRIPAINRMKYGIKRRMPVPVTRLLRAALRTIRKRYRRDPLDNSTS